LSVVAGAVWTLGSIVEDEISLVPPLLPVEEAAVVVMPRLPVTGTESVVEVLPPLMGAELVEPTVPPLVVELPTLPPEVIVMEPDEVDVVEPVVEEVARTSLLEVPPLMKVGLVLLLLLLLLLVLVLLLLVLVLLLLLLLLVVPATEPIERPTDDVEEDEGRVVEPPGGLLFVVELVEAAAGEELEVKVELVGLVGVTQELALQEAPAVKVPRSSAHSLLLTA
jgi:hypothetical protein